MNEPQLSFLEGHHLLTYLEPDEVQIIKNTALFESHEVDDMVITEGEKALFLLIVYQGTLAVFVEDFDGEKELATLAKGDFMGEISIISNQPASASIKCLSKVDLIAIPKDVVVSIKNKNTHFCQFLSKTSIARFEENLTKQI